MCGSRKGHDETVHWVGLSEPSTLINAVSTKFSRNGSNVYLYSCVHEKSSFLANEVPKYIRSFTHKIFAVMKNRRNFDHTIGDYDLGLHNVCREIPIRKLLYEIYNN